MRFLIESDVEILELRVVFAGNSGKSVTLSSGGAGKLATESFNSKQVPTFDPVQKKDVPPVVDAPDITLPDREPAVDSQFAGVSL